MNESSQELEILTYPDDILAAKAQSVTLVDDALQQLVDAMILTMYAAPGIGLAANQVGQLKRLIVFERQPGEGGRNPLVLLNPEIVEREGRIVWEEACLSVPDYAAEVTRSARVCVRGYDRSEKPMEIEAQDLLAICLQHEIDHLDGILYIDHISSLKRALYRKRVLKKIRQG